MQIGDKITFVNHDGQEVEVEVLKVYTGKEEGTGKQLIQADLKETISGRMHTLVPSQGFVKGARKIGYYVEKAFKKAVPTPKPEQTKPSQPAKPAQQPQQKTATVTDPAPTEQKGKNIQINVEDNTQASDK